MATASRKPTWKNGNKRPMPRNAPVGSQGSDGRNFVLGRGITRSFPMKTFARLTHESSDGSESTCRPFWAPKPVDPHDILVDTFKHADDGLFLVHHQFFQG